MNIYQTKELIKYIENEAILKKELLEKDENRIYLERETYNNKIDKAVDEIKQKLIFKDDKEIKKLLDDFKKL